METTLISYHNDPIVKAKYVARFAAHRAADEVIQGTGFDDETQHGCFVGCTLNDYNHKAFETELGWPEWLARLADAIFEGLDAKGAAQFGSDLLEAVPVGVDLDPVRWQLAIGRHSRQIEELKNNPWPYARQCETAIRQVVDFCRSSLRGEFSDSAARSAAYSAADSAADSARSAADSAADSARSAADSAADSAYSARSAARSAADSARSAADSAADSARSAADSAARKTYWQLERDELLRLVALRGNPSYSQTVFKDNGDPILLNADGTRSVFCDVDE